MSIEDIVEGFLAAWEALKVVLQELYTREFDLSWMGWAIAVAALSYLTWVGWTFISEVVKAYRDEYRGPKP